MRELTPSTETRPIKVLLVEDNPGDARLIFDLLHEASDEFDVKRVTRLESALDQVGRAAIDVVLLDLGLPGSQGLEAVARARLSAADKPIIVLSNLDDEDVALAAVRAGAEDYIPKGRIEGRSLARIIRHAIERKRTESRLAAIVRAALDAHITMDAEGTIATWNPQAEAVFGWPAQEVIGRRVADVVVPPAQRDAHWAGLRRFLKTGEGSLVNRRIELFALRRDGTEFPAELTIAPIRLGESWIFSAFLRDITDRKRNEEALAERTRVAELAAEIGAALTRGTTLAEILKGCCEALVRNLDASFARIWTLNEPLQMLELQASAGLYTHLDGPHSRVPVGKFKIGLIASERLPHVTNTVVGDPRVGDQEWAKREGMVAFAGFPLLVQDRVVGVAAMFARHPFTSFVSDALATVADSIAVAIERKRAEEALRASEQRASTLFQTVNLIVLGLDATGTIEYVNPFFLELTGFTPDEVIGASWFDRCLPQSQRAAVHDAFLQLLERNAHTHFQNSIVTRDGEERIVAWTNTVIRDAAGKATATLSLGEDVTDRTALELQLRQAQKMEAVGRLAGGIAHDFNNLLTAIFGYSDLLAEELPEGTPAREDLNEIRTAATRAAALTRQLLAFSRQQVLQPIVLNMNDVIGNLENMLQRVLGEDVALETHQARDLGNVKADPGQLEQVIMNLAVNARDAMPTGGKLTIETSNVALSGDYAAAHRPVAPGDYIMLAVSDSGIGMDETVKARLFEPFFTTKGVGAGTGLGLATVYGIVKQSGGYIWVYSEPGHGATFKVYLPRVQDPVEEVKQAPLPAANLSGTETILLAEDEALLRPLARELLVRLGYRVIEATNAAEALDLARAHPDEIHLLVSDVVMPGQSGLQLARQLATERPNMKVLYMSGYTDEAIVRHGLLDPGTNFLQKPFTPTVLARKVREVLDASRSTIP